MCILCVIQKWSRRVATMLPWLVIPLIGLWALSQLLPPAFRFEITSPRLACVFVLLVTLFWYEILMPQLSAWRVRRNARLRERKRFEALELQKLRKTATRRCRNCLTPYRDQNPGGGKFMCAYCGHISKRPVLDLPVPPGLGVSNSGIIKDLVGKGGKILNGKAWSDNGWMCSQDWLENGNWAGAPTVAKSPYWRKNGVVCYSGDENCLAEKSYSGTVSFVCKLLTSFFLSIRWLWRKIFRISSSEDASSNAEHRAMLAKRGENEVNYQESRGDKARRKAEEKRQARLEKELLEEEEKKQREEVARLVEERRKLRDEIMEVEKDRSRSSTNIKEKDGKKEAEKKRQEKRKEKDKGSSKCNCDVEDLDKRPGKESDRRKDFDKRSDTDREQKSGTENSKVPISESGHSIKNTSNFNRGNAGTRYLDRMRGTFLSSSKAFSGSGFFGKSANTPATVTKENKSSGTVHLVHSSSSRRDIFPPEHLAGKSSLDGEDKNINRSVLSETQPRTTPKKSWQQLFTRASSIPSSNTNVISRPNSKPQAESQSPQLPAQSSPIASFDNPIDFGLPSPFTVPPYTNMSSSSSLGFSPPIESNFPHVVDGTHEFIPEEPQLFEDPCDTPDERSLLGPLSESLNIAADMELERPNSLKNISVSHEMNKPSPIESPLSRMRIADEKHNGSTWFPTTPRAHDLHSLPVDDVHVKEMGTWQMWNSSPFDQDGLGLVGGQSWLLPPEWNRPVKEDLKQPPSQKTMASLFAQDDQIVSGANTPQKVLLGNAHNGGVFSPVTSSSDNNPWVQNAFSPPLSGSNDHFYLKAHKENPQNEMIFGNPNAAATNQPVEHPPANCWPNQECAMQGSGEVFGKSSITRPTIGGLFPTGDVQSLWSFDLQKWK